MGQYYYQVLASNIAGQLEADTLDQARQTAAILATGALCVFNQTLPTIELIKEVENNIEVWSKESLDRLSDCLFKPN